VRVRMPPVVLEPLLERDVVRRNLAGDVPHRLRVEFEHLSWVELGERPQLDAWRRARWLDRAGVDAGDPIRVRLPETVCSGEAPRRLLWTAGRQRRRDAKVAQVSFATLEERSTEAGFAGLRRDTDLQEPRALRALVF